MAAMPIITSKNEEHFPPRQTLLDIYIHDYLIKRKLYLTAKVLFEPSGKWIQFFDTALIMSLMVFYWRAGLPSGMSIFQPNAIHNILHYSFRWLKHRILVLIAPLLIHKKEFKAKVRKYLDDERNIIPQNFQKLLDHEVFKTPLKHPTPSSETIQSSKIPIIVIDDDDEEDEDQEERRRLAHDENQYFNPEELLKLLEDDYDAHRRNH